MDNKKIVLGALALDLKRVALGLQRNSLVMADRFTMEAKARKEELQTSTLPNYIQKLLNTLDTAVKDADSALMYSTLFQNYTLVN